MTGIDEILGEIRPATQTVTICVRGDLAERTAALERRRDELVAQDHGTLESGNDEELVDLDAEIGKLAEQAQSSMVDFVFAPIGWAAWSELLAKHPPIEGEFADHNQRTFPVEAIALSCIEPQGMTVEKVDVLASKVSYGQFYKLYEGARAANLAATTVPKAVPTTAELSARRRSSAPKRSTAVRAASPEASS